MYRIRFHGRGGQGIKTAANILGSAFFLAGFEVQDAPRYGAERRGAPIFAYVRAARATIHERGAITRPDLVVVADETLVSVPAAGVLQGVMPRTVLLLNSREGAEVWGTRLKCPGLLLVLPGSLGAAGEPAAIGPVCAGAAARLTGVIARGDLQQAVEREVASYGTTAIEASTANALAAFDVMMPHAGVVHEGVATTATGYVTPDWIDIPADDVLLAAPDIRVAATSEASMTGLWRTLRPVIDYAACNRCSWICSTLCPDSAIDVEPDHTPRIDYDHCKGCMICVAVCPPHAIRAEPEHVAPTGAAPR
jgi:pyruvate ferredoxin oxidoreductase gamma subunit